MHFRKKFLPNYLKHAPVPLALERTLECKILSQKEFTRPILDIGCGEGMFAHLLFEEKVDVGIDPDARELERAKQYDAYSELICCYGNKINKENGSFNTVFSNSVLEHIPDLEPVIKETHRLLSANGNLYITVPSNFFDNYSIVFRFLSIFSGDLAERYRKFFNKFWRHYHYYDVKGWQQLFEKNGFSLVESIEYGSKATCMTNDFLAPFSIVPFLCKKLFNKWTLLPFLRPIITLPVWFFTNEKKLEKAINIKNSGLLFFHFKKQS